ncbi:exodeoxyribonuclease VII large subunit [Flavitalea flava]
MAEKINDRTIFSLLEVTRSIQKTLSERYKDAYWIKAEMNKLNPHPPSGHCFPELLEKKDGKIIAEISANLWKDDFRRINDLFLKTLKEPLKNGINILFYAKIAYDPVYGLRLRIMDIDPSYSLGELEREKQETIDKMKNEGIYDANRLLKMPLLPKRIAIISVETSKGYSDFMNILTGNKWEYTFFHMLFPAILQGERSAGSIIHQLRRIKKVIHHFDAVAVIRGGGGEVGLTCYNDYGLAKEMALFPIPVITGIGHSTNETVAEMIAFKNAITPTALADYLLQKFHDFSVPVQQAKELVTDRSRRILKEEKKQLVHSVRYFRSVTGSMLINRGHQIREMARSLSHASFNLINEYRQVVVQLKMKMADQTAYFFTRENRELFHMEKTIDLLNPEKVLKRGYTITFKDSRLIKDAADLREGDLLKTVFSGGSLVSILSGTPEQEEGNQKQQYE